MGHPACYTNPIKRKCDFVVGYNGFYGVKINENEENRGKYQKLMHIFLFSTHFSHRVVEIPRCYLSTIVVFAVIN